MTEDRKRILVVDNDDDYGISNAKNFIGDLARTLLVDGSQNGDESAIADALSTEEYEVILLSGHLGLDPEGEYYDGAVVARKLRDGIYGPTNQQTRILATRVLPVSDGDFDLRYFGGSSFDKITKEGARSYLKWKGII